MAAQNCARAVSGELQVTHEGQESVTLAALRDRSRQLRERAAQLGQDKGLGEDSIDEALCSQVTRLFPCASQENYGKGRESRLRGRRDCQAICVRHPEIRDHDVERRRLAILRVRQSFDGRAPVPDREDTVAFHLQHVLQDREQLPIVIHEENS